MTSITVLLLQTAMTLLLLVQGNPNIDPALKTQAIVAANQAIKIATKQSGAGYTAPQSEKSIVTNTDNTPADSNPASPDNSPRFTAVPQNVKNIVAGKVVSFLWSVKDTDSSALAWTIDWGESGEVVGTGCSVSDTTLTRAHTWDKPGTYTVEATVSDCSGGLAVSTFLVHVASIAASVNILLPDGTSTFVTGNTLPLKVALQNDGRSGTLYLGLSEQLPNGKPSDPAYSLATLVDISPGTAGSVVKNVTLDPAIVPGNYFVYAFWKSSDGFEIKSDFSNVFTIKNTSVSGSSSGSSGGSTSGSGGNGGSSDGGSSSGGSGSSGGGGGSSSSPSGS